MFGALQPITRFLLIANVAIFGAQWLWPSLIDTFALWPIGSGFEPWQIPTWKSGAHRLQHDRPAEFR
jgi:hypothetical protein